ncbi:MAG: N-acetylmuramoyl-L-alanine amidase family protein [Omnitrophica WOR_2 bacterium]
MGLKRFFYLIILSVVACTFTLKAEGQKVRKVVIDAGHGGHDPGALGKTYNEKDIALSIALKTGRFIEENLPDVQVIYTRKTDVFVELYRRAKIANEAKADLFISIHCNANKSSTPYGTESYVMGLHKSEANLSVAQAENASILLEDNYNVRYDGFDPSSPEGYIFFSMLQNAYIDQSIGFATSVQKHFKERVNMFDRGVKQAGFLVLYKTTMPSVLIETGFISNSKEERLLASDEGQTYIASAIFRAVRDYKASIEKTSPLLSKKETTDNLPDRQTVQASEKIELASTGPVAANDKELLAQKDNVIPLRTDTVENNTKDKTIEIQDNTANQGNAKPSDENIVFKVQFLISKSLKKSSDPEFKGLTGVENYQHNGFYKYTYGSEKTPQLAAMHVKELNALGFKDCFVVAFKNNERIDLEEAKRLLKN